jgi:hypothetical protein
VSAGQESYQGAGSGRSYFDTVRSLSTDPEVLAAVAEVEAEEVFGAWKERVGWLDITHHWPYRLLFVWRGLFCHRNWHLFDEVWSGGPEGRHYLSCDACDLAVTVAPSVPVESLESL